MCKGVYFGKKTWVFLVNIELGRAPKKMQISFPKGEGGREGGQKNMHFSGQYLIGTTLKKFSFFFKGGGVEEEYEWRRLVAKKHLKLQFLAQNNLSANSQHFFCNTL